MRPVYKRDKGRRNCIKSNCYCKRFHSKTESKTVHLWFESNQSCNGGFCKDMEIQQHQDFYCKRKANGTCKLTAKKAGTAKLQITLASGLKKTVTVKVQKSNVKTTKVSVSNKNVSVKKGKKLH